jgi:myosin heavy subunit
VCVLCFPPDEFGEGAVVHQLRERYSADAIYTNIGSILVSINPYKHLPIYAAAHVDAYRVAAEQGPQALTNLEPHVFAIAAEAYAKLYEDDGGGEQSTPASAATSSLTQHNQAVIISGESGAGKTEATKTVLQYLSTVAGSVSGVEQQILLTNPILEAFGNAKTLRNNNSSRFGKWQEVHFQPVGTKGASGGGGRKIIAARIVNYLLELSRVTMAQPGERSYHILYQMLSGLDPALRARFSLDSDPAAYHYLRQSGCYAIEGVDDAEDFAHTQQAMRALQFDKGTEEQIWQLLAAILQLGNLQPQPHAAKADVTVISNREALELLCTRTLALPSADVLASALCYRSVTIRGSISMVPLKLEEVAANRDALAKTLFSKLFDFLIARINAVLYTASGMPDRNSLTDAQRKAGRSIGILDIFGFEVFENNKFEQCQCCAHSKHSTDRCAIGQGNQSTL